VVSPPTISFSMTTLYPLRSTPADRSRHAPNPHFDPQLKYVLETIGIVDPGNWGDPYGGYYVGQAAAPFALATPHHAPQATIAAMQAGWLPPYITAPRADKPILDGGGWRTGPYWD
jgi:hypothetical protein